MVAAMGALEAMAEESRGAHCSSCCAVSMTEGGGRSSTGGCAAHHAANSLIRRQTGERETAIALAIFHALHRRGLSSVLYSRALAVYLLGTRKCKLPRFVRALISLFDFNFDFDSDSDLNVCTLPHHSRLATSHPPIDLPRPPPCLAYPSGCVSTRCASRPPPSASP